MSGHLSCTSVTPDTQPCGSRDDNGMGWGCGGSSERGGPRAVGAEHRQSQLRLAFVPVYHIFSLFLFVFFKI